MRETGKALSHLFTHPMISNGPHSWASLSIDFALGLVCVWLAPGVIYCVAMLAASALQKRTLIRAKTSDGAADVARRTRFHVLIPAHDESLVIASTLKRLMALNYPQANVRYTVVADNCADDTAELARGVRDVAVLERRDPDACGKGHALNWALNRILPEHDADAIVIIDADTLIDGDFLAEMDREIQSCSSEERAGFVAQGHYTVHNVEDNWRTGLMTGALLLVHFVRPLARERCQTSVGLKGNGMCFAAGVLERCNWPGDSVTEDLDYGLDLIENLGLRVRFVPRAIVEAQMPTDSETAAKQRRRWEGGRKLTVHKRLMPLLKEGIKRRDRIRLDAAFDLICPPLAQQAAGLVVWLALIVLAAVVGSAGALPWLIGWAASAAGLALYVVGGFKVAGAPKTAYKALLMAAWYVPWKIAALVFGKKQAGWNRTERHAMEPNQNTDLGVAKELP
jgi:1,2-diacylglycerol 3-beta-glucosyltransferase